MADIYFFPERHQKPNDLDVANPYHGEEINLALKYGISIKDGEDITHTITPDFKRGAVYANDAILQNGQNLKVDWQGHATIVRRYWSEESRTSLKGFVYGQIAYTHKTPIDTWAEDFKRGVDAEIARRAHAVKYEFHLERDSFAHRKAWEARHPILSLLSHAAAPLTRIARLIS